MRNQSCDIGLLGLGVMGRNFVLNMADHGFSVGVYNRTKEKTHKFMEEDVGHRDIRAGYILKDFLDQLRRPRTVLISVPAGGAVDEVIGELVPNLDPGDLIVDTGNSHFKETDRRHHSLSEKGMLFLGMGISGGESGARHGPSLMPGGAREGYERIRSILEASAAQIDGIPCVAYLGPGSAGHYVKMVHNGIEYGIMQLIAESYDLMKRGMDLDAGRLHEIYSQWAEGALNSYLMEITADIFLRKDERTGDPLVDLILDQAKQKGTGKWTSMESLELQVPIPTIEMAVMMRDMSGYKNERVKAEEALRGPDKAGRSPDKTFLNQLENALYAGILMSYAQGMTLLRRADKAYAYGLDLEAVATIWRGGCIIRARLLEDIRRAYHSRPDLSNLLLDSRLGGEVISRQNDLRSVVCGAADLGIPVPGLAASLSYFDAYRSARLPANLTMAQRDYFGAHRYERIDARGTFHTQWETTEEKI